MFPWKSPLTPATVLEELTLSGRQFAVCAIRFAEERRRLMLKMGEDSLPDISDTCSLLHRALCPPGMEKMASFKQRPLKQ